MWAVIEKETSRVCGVITPDIKKEDLEKFQNISDIILIPMTLENSPGWIGGIYKDGKFYE